MTIPLFYSEHYIADIGSHIMPIHKFRLVRDAIVSSQLPVSFHQPDPIQEEELLQVHTREYVEAIKTGAPKHLAESQKFPWSSALAEAVRHTNGGCIAALDAALRHQISGNLASGFHHAHADHGEGFCTFNGLILALERAYQQQKITRGLVIDLDLHYGNGTASLVAARPYCANLSIYGSWYKQNVAYKDVEQERAPDSHNAWSLPVPNGSSGAQYLRLIQEHAARAVESYQPDIILYQAGADPYREDPYSPLDVGLEDLYERDQMIFSLAKEKRIPIAYVLAGGYTKDISKIVEVHLNTYKAALAVFGEAL
jgi:acetoin utilization deacetylase AcuC-like enzyme